MIFGLNEARAELVPITSDVFERLCEPIPFGPQNAALRCERAPLPQGLIPLLHCSIPLKERAPQQGNAAVQLEWDHAASS